MSITQSKRNSWITDIKDLPNKPGIYIICSEFNNITTALYVGQSKNIKRRLNSTHPAYMKAIAEFGTIFVNWELIPDDSRRNYRESLLIGQLKPKYNFGGSKSITDNYGFPSDTWELITPKLITGLADSNNESVELCYSWLKHTWEYKQHGILFEYLNKDREFKILQDLKHLTLDIASKRHTKTCDLNKFYNEDTYNALSNIFKNIYYPEYIRQIYTIELEQYTQSIKPFFIFGHIREWMYSHQINNVISCLIMLQGLAIPSRDQLVNNKINKKVYHFLNKNLIDWNYNTFTKEGYTWLKERHQETDSFENELKLHGTKIESNVLSTKEVWETDVPYDFWNQVIFWSLIKNEPYILLPPYMLDDWYNYNVLEYIYKSKHQVESFYSRGHISSKDFIIAFYHWCLDNNKIPEINLNNNYDDKSMAHSKVRIGK
jgi:hypothetical protein